MKSLSAKIVQVLLIPILLTVILYFGRPVLVPVFFAIILAMLMAPVCRWLEARNWNRAVACVACILILLIAIVGLVTLVAVQMADFAENMDKIKQKIGEIWESLQQRIETAFGLTQVQQEKMVDGQMDSLKKSSSAGAAKLAAGIVRTLGNTAITLVFTFLLLYHKEKYEQFFLKLFAGSPRDRVKKTLCQITHVSQQYLTGRILSMIFLFILYAVALLIIGIHNAVLLSAIAALLTIVPYVGPIAGGLFPFMTAVVTESSIQPAVWVLVAMIVIQAIDNYFIEPNVIGGEVRLTALSTILSIVVGGMIWGIAGMILFIPLLSIVKIVCDQVDALKPFGFVVGDEGKSPSSKLLSIFGKKK